MSAFFDGDFGSTGDIYEGQPAGSAAVLVTAGGDNAFISRIIATNTTTAAVTVSLWHGLAGAADATGNEMANAEPVAANGVVTVFDAGPDGLPMGSGDVIRGLCSVSGAVVLRIIGRN
jgi:hypothetical protein